MNARPGTALRQLQWLEAIRQPRLVLDWTLADWEYVVRIARRLRLLARLAESTSVAGLLADVPPQPRRHLIAEQQLSICRTAAMTWLIERVRPAIDPSDGPCVLLKGAAYLAQDLPIAAGRLPSDVDILVARHRLPNVQASLKAAGWMEAGLDEHDQRYYVEWSHEVPPMRHPLHPLELDLHHNILPRLAKTHVDVQLLFSRLRASKWKGWQVLDPVDQVLHCAAHLFFDSEARDRVRDLVDLDGLFRHFGSDDRFWACLPERALQLGLTEPLALACHFCVNWLGTPVPAAAQDEMARVGPSQTRLRWLLPLLASLLDATEPDSCPSMRQGFARWLFLARYQHRRLPLRLMVPHAWHKLVKRRRLPDSHLPRLQQQGSRD